MKFKMDENYYDVIVEKKNNKNTYIRVNDDLTIHVTTSYFTSNRFIEKLLNENYDYLKKIIDKKTIKNEDTRINYLGNKYELIFCNVFNNIEFDNDKIYSKDISMYNKWLKKEILNLYKERLDYFYNLFEEKIPYPKLKIRSMKTRWGVCNKKDNSVTLNSRLIEYSIDKLDYVIIHELSHFIHFNHSNSFWTLVSKYEPNYKKIRKDLKD